MVYEIEAEVRYKSIVGDTAYFRVITKKTKRSDGKESHSFRKIEIFFRAGNISNCGIEADRELLASIQVEDRVLFKWNPNRNGGSGFDLKRITAFDMTIDTAMHLLFDR